ncbi:LacI family DNA-binding transcriptional regulator [Synoicihabitans lomoniglobus]|uniref:LacI family DNA-binding transcriptional regulator n=1 Tax=Synoicihabitans lomoniglobus TaxID=2909285 RepID=A0AAF0I689_9BACT|nr:LacI family transcriptional regulator [Opitutaceae bacterium LMO-M01]WED65956.1 LacI family DNA-binding transcriptional regulator [Opitutaceae bacterium LMO-M01]
MSKRITQKDIARHLHLDKSTVSLALRDAPAINPTTRDRVMKAAKELGYRPDPALAVLAQCRWAGHEKGSGSVLAYLMDLRIQGGEQHGRFLPAAKARAEERGFILQVFDLAEYASLEQACRVLSHRGIRGLLAPQFLFGDDLERLNTMMKDFTVIGLDLGFYPIPFHVVAPDVFETGRLVWETVVKRGYRRIGCAVLQHQPEAYDDRVRLGAAMAQQHKLVPPQDHIPLLTSAPDDRDSFCRWMDRYQPDVVIGFISRVYRWIESTGRKVPEDVAYASLMVLMEEFPDHSGAPVPNTEIAVTGVDALIAAIHANEWGVPQLQRKFILEPVWHEGNTLPDRTEAVVSRVPHLVR